MRMYLGFNSTRSHFDSQFDSMCSNRLSELSHFESNWVLLSRFESQGGRNVTIRDMIVETMAIL